MARDQDWLKGSQHVVVYLLVRFFIFLETSNVMVDWGSTRFVDISESLQ